jgi:hypothetical protein
VRLAVLGDEDGGCKVFLHLTGFAVVDKRSGKPLHFKGKDQESLNIFVIFQDAPNSSLTIILCPQEVPSIVSFLDSCAKGKLVLQTNELKDCLSSLSRLIFQW